MSTKLPSAWTMVNVSRKMAERIVPLRSPSRLNLKLPVKKMVLSVILRMLTSRKTAAPSAPGMPPSPSTGPGSSSPAWATGAGAELPPASLPMFFRCCMFFSIVPGLWIMFHSSVASLPRNAVIACSPPGWIGIHFTTLMTSPLTQIHASSFLLCFASSAKEMPVGPAGAAAAGGPAAFSALTRSTSSSFVMSSGFLPSFVMSSACTVFMGFVKAEMIRVCRSMIGIALPPRAATAAARPAMRPE
mmetsp:Transcript_3013/g.8289  ORF Transcript_3013/g.8289 Transcript_3013/m.8289 type:complete len:245 (+) Transcript_3013:1090-1824(+)